MTPHPITNQSGDAAARPTYDEVVAALVRLENAMANEDILKLRLDTVAAKFGASEIIHRIFATNEMAGNA
jgi:5-methylcytosine-specific restriction endonuclease McrBC GTP-binding regulatory subunit McrB